MQDWDNFSNEILQIFIVRLMVNLHFKYNHNEFEKREDAIKSIKLLSKISNQFLSREKPIYKQFNNIFNYVALYFNNCKNQNLIL